MVTTVTVGSHVTHGFDRFYVRVMLKAARPLLVHTNWAQVKDIPQNNTDLVRFRRYTLLAAATSSLSEGSAPTGKTVSVSNVGGTVKCNAVLKFFLDNLGTLDCISSMVVS